jgi:LPXTG-site transpeptidase (sortase) family protein
MDTSFELRFPSLNINLPLSSVGLTAENVMDVPRGSVNDPAWQTAFWYRGSGLPGEGGTMTVAGHVTDLLGQPGAFAHIGQLQSGDVIVVYNQVLRRGVEYIVTDTQTYSPAQSADPAVIAKVYGHGPLVVGRSTLTLITCTGTFVDGSFVDRLVVYAQMAIIPLYEPQ